jgi:hypothetical protein
LLWPRGWEIASTCTATFTSQLPPPMRARHHVSCLRVATALHCPRHEACRPICPGRCRGSSLALPILRPTKPCLHVTRPWPASQAGRAAHSPGGAPHHSSRVGSLKDKPWLSSNAAALPSPQLNTYMTCTNPRSGDSPADKKRRRGGVGERAPGCDSTTSGHGRARSSLPAQHGTGPAHSPHSICEASAVLLAANTLSRCLFSTCCRAMHGHAGVSRRSARTTPTHPRPCCRRPAQAPGRAHCSQPGSHTTQGLCLPGVHQPVWPETHHCHALVAVQDGLQLLLGSGAPLLRRQRQPLICRHTAGAMCRLRMNAPGFSVGASA